MFQCQVCRRTYNEHTSTPFNFIEVSTDILFQVLFCRVRYQRGEMTSGDFAGPAFPGSRRLESKIGVYHPKVSELSTHSIILNNGDKIPIKRKEELTLLELYPDSLSQ